MSSLIQIKNTAISGSAPTNLAQGELAINVTNGRLFYGSGSANIVKEFTGSGGGVSGTINTGSLLTTASFNAYTGSNTSQFAGTASFALTSSRAVSASYALTASYVLQAVSASYATTASFAITSSRATTASYALNGGVTQLLAGSNVTLSPASGLGQVTVSATLSGSTIFNTATGSYGSFYDTTTQTNPVANIPRSMSLNETDISNGVSVSGSTNPFNTYIKTQNAGVYNIQFSAQVEKTDSGTDVIVIWLRKNGIDLTDSATKLTLSGNNTKVVAAWNWFVSSAANDYYQIIWVSADTGMRLYAEPINDTPGIPSVIVTVNRVDQFLSNTGSFSGSFTGQFTGSLFGTSSWATNSLTASRVNTLNQSVIITGSVTIGSSSIGPSENTLTLGPSPGGGTGEGGQLGLQAAGGSYTSASFIDTWQDQFRILRGPNNTSNAGLMYMNLQSGNTQFVGAITASAYNGLPNDYLYAIRSGSNQTVGSNWVSQDIIFNSTVVSKGISFNTSTGIASLTGGKVYRVTARLAWAAAATYNLQYSCYTSANTQIGPTVEIVQSANGTNNISDGTLEFIYAPVSNTDIKIRTTANNTALSGEQIRADLNTQLIIQQIA
jgi:hypothetical protein